MRKIVFFLTIAICLASCKRNQSLFYKADCKIVVPTKFWLFMTILFPSLILLFSRTESLHILFHLIH